MIVINFYGSPGAGKSTLATQLFVNLKKQNYNVEFAAEYAKDCLYEERYSTIQDQLYLFAKMNHKLQCFQKMNVDYVISDSPLLLNILFKERQERMKYIPNDIWKQFIYSISNSYQNINFVIKRDTSIAYNQRGRFESEEQSSDLENKLTNILKESNQEIIKIINSKEFNIKSIESILINKGVLK